MKAKLLFHDKYIYGDGAIREMKLWRLPGKNAERPHGLKYSLYYGLAGESLIRYDNERGKGDHRHYRNREESYRFISVEQLIEDFASDIRQERGEANG